VKTISLRKKVAAIAVASLGFGLLSVVPANASNWDDDDFLQCETAAVSTAEGSCVTTVGSQVIVSNRLMDFGADGWDNAANGAYAAAYLAESATWYIEVKGASIQTVKNDGTLTTNTPGDLNGTAGDAQVAYGNGGGTSDADGLIEITTDATAAADITASRLDIALTSAVAADATVTVFYYGTGGVKTVVETHTITWATAAGAGSYSVSTTNSSIGVVGTGDCNSQATPSAGKARLAAEAVTAAYYLAGVSADLCIYTFDGLGNAITPASVVVFATKGFVQTSDANTGTTASATIGAPGAGFSVSGLKGDSLQKGTATVTAIVTDSLGGVITLSTPFIWSGALASLTLTNNKFSATGVGAVTDAITVEAKDADGNKIPFSLWTDAAAGGSVTTAITAGASDLLVASDAGAGVAGTALGDNNAYATVAVSADADATAGQTSNGAIDVTCAAAKYETISLTLFGYDAVATAAAGTAKQTVKSNTVKYNCVESTVAAVTVTPTATSVAAGATTTVNISATTASGRPVADATAVTLATSSGNTITAGSGSTLNGSLLVPGTFVAGNSGGPATVTAVVGTASGTKAITVTGASSPDSLATSIASLNAKIVALNALIAKIMKRLNIR